MLQSILTAALVALVCAAQPPADEKSQRTPAQQKIGSALLYEIYRARGEAERKGVPPGDTGVRIDDHHRALVDVRAAVTPALHRSIRRLGGVTLSSSAAAPVDHRPHSAAEARNACRRSVRPIHRARRGGDDRSSTPHEVRDSAISSCPRPRPDHCRGRGVGRPARRRRRAAARGRGPRHFRRGARADFGAPRREGDANRGAAEDRLAAALPAQNGSGDQIADGVWILDTDVPYAVRRPSRRGRAGAARQRRRADARRRPSRSSSASDDGSSFRAHIEHRRGRGSGSRPRVIFVQPRQDAIVSQFRPGRTSSSGRADRTGEPQLGRRRHAPRVRGARRVPRRRHRHENRRPLGRRVESRREPGQRRSRPVTVSPGAPCARRAVRRRHGDARDRPRPRAGRAALLRDRPHQHHEFRDNIRALRAAGCDIIVDDVFYFVEYAVSGRPARRRRSDNGGVVIQAVNDVGRRARCTSRRPATRATSTPARPARGKAISPTAARRAASAAVRQQRSTMPSANNRSTCMTAAGISRYSCQLVGSARRIGERLRPVPPQRGG